MTKAACVIGATGGIGSAVVRALRRDEWSPVLELDRDGPIAVDVSDEGSVERAFAQARREVRSIGLLVIASGILDLNKLSTLSAARWNEVIAVNLTGPFLCCEAAQTWLSDGGRIVLLGSLAGRTGGVLTGTAYAASKGGIESLTKSIANELAPRRITVNCVAPGGVDTPMLAQNSAEQTAKLAAATPLGRMATADEIAAAVMFLASEQAAFITGAVIPVNGGIRMD
jgi:NAD(P)-dependent dehydrogenase (short-subunit alcohol dehydrogenase family)